MLLTEFLGQRCAHDNTAHAGGGIKVRLARLPARGVECYSKKNHQHLSRSFAFLVHVVLSPFSKPSPTSNHGARKQVKSKRVVKISVERTLVCDGHFAEPPFDI